MLVMEDFGVGFVQYDSHAFLNRPEPNRSMKISSQAKLKHLVDLMCMLESLNRVLLLSHGRFKMTL